MTAEVEGKKSDAYLRAIKAIDDLVSLLMPKVVNTDAQPITATLGWRRALVIDPTTDLARLIIIADDARGNQRNESWDSISENTFAEHGPRGGLRGLRFRHVSNGVTIPEGVLRPSKLRDYVTRLFNKYGITVNI